MRAVRHVPAAADVAAVYRGWMLTPDEYTGLYGALAGRGVWLITNPAAYRHAHWLPEWYPLLTDVTPRSVWLPAAAAADPALLNSRRPAVWRWAADRQGLRDGSQD